MTTAELTRRIEVYDAIIAEWEEAVKDTTEERADELREDVIDLRAWREMVWEQIPMRTKAGYTRRGKVIGYRGKQDKAPRRQTKGV